jgi:hypothetical protein
MYLGLIVEETLGWRSIGPTGKRYRCLGTMFADPENLGDDAATIEDQDGFVDVVLV